MHLAILLTLAAFLTLSSALSENPFIDPNATPDALARCRNPRSKPSASCWQTFGMDAFMSRWNRTTTTCGKKELWANCFMRQQTGRVVEDIGCAQVGPNTCPEPSQSFTAANGSAENFYGAHSIWSIQQYLTTIYNNIISPNNTALIQSAYGLFNPPVYGHTILYELLYRHREDARNKTLSLVLAGAVHGKPEAEIVGEEQAQREVGRVVSVVLEHVMSDFGDGAYAVLATGGKMV